MNPDSETFLVGWKNKYAIIDESGEEYSQRAEGNLGIYTLEFRNEKDEEIFTIKEDAFKARASLLSALPNKEGGLWLPGRYHNYEVSNFYYGRFAKVDQKGKIIFDTLLEDPGYWPGVSIEMKDGSLLNTGTFAPGERHRPYVLKINDEGKIEWLIENKDILSGAYDHVIKLGENYLLIGRKIYTREYLVDDEWMDIITPQGKRVATYKIPEEIIEMMSSSGENAYFVKDENTLCTVRYSHRDDVNDKAKTLYFITMTLP